MSEVIVPTILKIYGNDNGVTKLIQDESSFEMEIDSVYYFEGVDTKYKAQCIYRDDTTAIMQTYGTHAGTWPGTLTIPSVLSNYSSAMSNFRLPTGTSASNIAVAGASGTGATSAKLLEILKTAAGNYSSFGASDSKSWLKPYGSMVDGCYVNSSGGVGSSSKSYNFVIAPAFDIDLTKIKINATNTISLK